MDGLDSLLLLVDGLGLLGHVDLVLMDDLKSWTSKLVSPLITGSGVIMKSNKVVLGHPKLCISRLDPSLRLQQCCSIEHQHVNFISFFYTNHLQR